MNTFSPVFYELRNSASLLVEKWNFFRCFDFSSAGDQQLLLTVYEKNLLNHTWVSLRPSLLFGGFEHFCFEWSWILGTRWEQQCMTCKYYWICFLRKRKGRRNVRNARLNVLTRWSKLPNCQSNFFFFFGVFLIQKFGFGSFLSSFSAFLIRISTKKKRFMATMSAYPYT